MIKHTVGGKDANLRAFPKEKLVLAYRRGPRSMGINQLVVTELQLVEGAGGKAAGQGLSGLLPAFKQLPESLDSNLVSEDDASVGID